MLIEINKINTRVDNIVLSKSKKIINQIKINYKFSSNRLLIIKF